MSYLIKYIHQEKQYYKCFMEYRGYQMNIQEYD